MTNVEGNPNDEIRNGSPLLAHGFVIRASSLIRHSSFVLRHLILSFHIPNRRESRDRLADPCQLGRCNYLINIFVSATCFLRETCPRAAADVNAASFEIALKLFTVPLFARFGTAHRAAAPVCSAKESFCA